MRDGCSGEQHNGGVNSLAAEPLPDDVETLKAMLLGGKQAHRAEIRARRC